MSTEIKELKVAEYDQAKKVIYLSKELLLNAEKMNLIGTTNSANIATKAAETLVRLGYVTFDNIQTLTEVKNDRRSIRLIITLKKTSNFDKLYKENEEERKKRQAERDAQPKEAAK